MPRAVRAPSFCTALLALPMAAQVRFDVGAMDKSADPCSDFYQYACGNWMKNNPIPADQARWGRFSELEERNRETLRAILDEAAKPDANRDAVTRQIGDYYAACMDEKGIDAKGLKPIQPELDRIAGLEGQSRSWRPKSPGCTASAPASLFDFSSGQDFKDSTKVIAQFDQGGLGLPERDYYLKDDAEVGRDCARSTSPTCRRCSSSRATRRTRRRRTRDVVMRLETALAKGSLDNVSRRDPEKIYHKMTRARPAGARPRVPVERVLPRRRRPRLQRRSTSRWPDFVKAVERADPGRQPRRLEDLPPLASDPLRRRRCCRPPSRRRTSTSTARALTGADGACARAGSAAWTSPTTSSARRWAGSSSRRRSARRARSAP